MDQVQINSFIKKKKSTYKFNQWINYKFNIHKKSTYKFKCHGNQVGNET